MCTLATNYKPKAMSPSSTSAALTFSNSLPHTKDTAPFRFMDLPAELRIHVYEELVVVGKIFFTPSPYEVRESCRFTDYTKYRKPSLTILRVSKDIHKEAEDLYLSRNLFVLPLMWYCYRTSTIPPYEFVPWTTQTAREKRFLFSGSAVERVKHISIALDNRSDEPITMSHSMWTQQEMKEPGVFDRLSFAQRLRSAHTHAIEKLSEERSWVFTVLMAFTGLWSVEIDVSNAYCPVGCCRMLDIEWDELADLELKTVQILGTRGEAEQSMLLYEQERQALIRGIGWEQVVEADGFVDEYELTFDGKEDMWDQWKVVDSGGAATA